MPSAAYRATVPAPFDASSSGCACTDTRHNGLPATSSGRTSTPKLVAAVAVPAQERGRYIARMSRRLLRVLRRARVRRGDVVGGRTRTHGRGRGRGDRRQQRALGVAARAASRLQCATLTRPGRLHAARRRAGRPRGVAAAGPPTRPAPRLAGVQLRRSRRRRAPRRCRASPPHIPAAIRARYDLVSFDPRGTGKSRPVECVDDATADRLNAVDPDPELRRRAAVVLRRHPRTRRPRRALRRHATARGSPRSGAATWPATSTGSAPRSATTRCRYLGFSYGTVIGAVYAQMFPDRVGRMVLDSPVDLSANALEELRGELRRASSRRSTTSSPTARHARSCAFHDERRPRRPRSPRSRRGSSRACSSPPPTSTPAKRTSRKAGVAAFYTALISALYDKQYGWPVLADALARRRSAATAVAALPRRLLQRAARRRHLRQHQRGHRRDPLRRPRRRRSRRSTSTRAEYHRERREVPVPRRLRREHACSAATRASRGRRRRRRSATSASPTPRRS